MFFSVIKHAKWIQDEASFGLKMKRNFFVRKKRRGFKFKEKLEKGKLRLEGFKLGYSLKSSFCLSSTYFKIFSYELKNCRFKLFHFEESKYLNKTYLTKLPYLVTIRCEANADSGIPVSKI